MAAVGFTPISLYYSATASAVPSAGNLVPGELALNTADGKLYYKSLAGVVTLLAGATAGPAGGSNTQVQFNSSGVLAGSANLTWSGTALAVTGALSATGNVTLSGGTANGVAYLNGSKVLTTGSALTFDGTNLGVGSASLSSASGRVDVTINGTSSSIVSLGTGGTRRGYMIHDGTDLTLANEQAAGALRFVTSAGESMRIASATGGVGAVGIGYTSLTSVGNNGLAVLGNVGIGTSSPNYKLQVNGSLDIINIQGTGANAFYRATSVSSVGDFSFGVDDSAGVGGGNSYIIYDRKNSAYRFIINNAGDVGIGLMSGYTGKLAVNGVIATYASSDNNYRGSIDVETGNLKLTAPPYAANPTNITFCTGTSSTERARIDSSGNLGIGTTAPLGLLNIKGSNGQLVLNNGNSSGGVRLSAFTNAGTANGYLAFEGYSSEYGRFDSSGNLLVGGTSNAAGARLISENASGNQLGLRYTSVATWYNSVDSSGNYIWTKDGTNIARFDSSGNLLVGTNGRTNLERLGVVFTGNNEGAYFANGSASPTGSGITVNFFDATGTNGTACILYKGRTAGADRFYVYGNGNVVNTNNSYGALSDIKHKENIVDATPKLEKLNQVRVVNFNIKGDSQKQIGVIAQELEQVFPSMVDESPDKDVDGNDLGTVTKSVKYSVFVPMLIKALQEQQAIIQSLTARITALEGA